MSNNNQNKEFSSKLLLIAALAIAFLSACDQQDLPSDPVSDSTAISSEDNTSEDTAPESTSSEQPSDTSADSQLPDDGKLRVADSPADNGGTTVFCGSKIVYDGDGTVSAFEGDEYFYVRRIVGDGYRSTVYNRDGEQLLEIEGGYPQLAGKWLISGGDMYGAPEELTVYDIDTLEQVMLGGDEQQSQFCFEVNGYLCATTYDYGATDTIIYNSEDLSVAAEFPGCSASTASDLDGFINLMRYDEASGESWTIYYRPSDGRQYDDVQSVCGENLVTVRMDGDYQVYDVTAEAVVAEGTNYTYYSDAVKIWRDYGSNVFVEAPCYDSAKEVMSAWCSWNTGDPYISVTCLDGSVEVLDLTGQLVNSRPSAEDKSLIYTNGGMIVESQLYGTEPGLTLCFPGGEEKQFERYNWLNTILQDKLMVGSYQFGQKYLYDLLDTDGNLLIEGLSNYSYPQDDGPIYVAKGFSYGFMDMEGNWLWKRSIFNSTVDETGNVYW